MTRKCLFLGEIRHKKRQKRLVFDPKTLKKVAFYYVFDAFFNRFSPFLSQNFIPHSKPNNYFSTLINVIGKMPQ